jgi:hypothetical protein
VAVAVWLGGSVLFFIMWQWQWQCGSVAVWQCGSGEWQCVVLEVGWRWSSISDTIRRDSGVAVWQFDSGSLAVAVWLWQFDRGSVSDNVAVAVAVWQRQWQ